MGSLGIALEGGRGGRACLDRKGRVGRRAGTSDIANSFVGPDYRRDLYMSGRVEEGGNDCMFSLVMKHS